MKKVRMTPIALKDLKEIKSYISEELLSEEATLITVKYFWQLEEKIGQIFKISPIIYFRVFMYCL